MNSIIATYRLTCLAEEVERLSRDIALEQTVEVPESMIRCEILRETVVGKVDSITAVASTSDADRFQRVGTKEESSHLQQFDVVIRYSADLAASSLVALINLLYGNISLKPGILLRDLQLPDTFLAEFRGPKFGIHGIRKILGVWNRPLLATALKPRGSSDEELAVRAHDFAAGGGDLVKDDHNLVDKTFDAFRKRVELSHLAVLRGNELTGGNCLYFPNLFSPVDELEARAEFLVRLGVRGVLVAPLILGLDQIRHLSGKFPLAFLAHPTFAGAYMQGKTHGIDPGLMLGTFFRIAGCDGTIFPNAGGRFSFDAAECIEISRRSTESLGTLRPIWPAPAGGMTYDNIPQMAKEHGTDAIYLIGGALLGDSNDLQSSTRRFLQRIESLYTDSERAVPSADSTQAECLEAISSCELPGHRKSNLGISELIRFLDGFRWDARPQTHYKATSDLAFRDVSRTELIGSFGEQTAFDVRYFEIAPGGFSSLEKHCHTHVIIGARGRGTLLTGTSIESLSPSPIGPYDLAYVASQRIHQLKNESTEMFGFFCIVDHVRDRPTAP